MNIFSWNKIKKYFIFNNINRILDGRAQQGFSIAELVVGIYVFSIVIVLGSGAIMAVLRSQRSLLKEQELLDNARGSLEVMSKALRLSYNYRVPAPGDTGINSILVDHPAKVGTYDCPSSGPCPVKYCRVVSGGKGIIYEQNCPNLNPDCSAGGTPIAGYGCLVVGIPQPLTSDQVNIRKLDFMVAGYGTGNTNQARVTVYMEFSPVLPQASGRVIPIQTTLTQRVLDIP